MIDSTLISVSSGSAVLGVLNLIQRHRLHAARHDPLTGLPARQLWRSRAHRAMRRPHRLVFLIVDGDGLKRINDRHGHEAGDTLLVAFAQRLRAWTAGRGLAARLGGDEFAAYVHLTDGESPADRLETLCGNLSAPVPYCGRTLRAGASIGAAVVAEVDPPTFSQVMRVADEALYQAKHDGRGTWRLAGQLRAPRRPTHDSLVSPGLVGASGRGIGIKP